MQSFVDALLTPEVKIQGIPEDHVYLTWDREKGVVYEFGKKSADTLNREKKKKEKEELEDENYRMNMAIEEMELRRLGYRAKDIEDYGYDKYTEEFYYEPEPENDDIVYDST